MRRDYYQDLGVEGRVILKWIGCDRGLDPSSSGQGKVAGCCEHGNELLVSIKRGEFLG
jgi:hypothetical protein